MAKTHTSTRENQGAVGRGNLAASTPGRLPQRTVHCHERRATERSRPEPEGQISVTPAPREGEGHRRRPQRQVCPTSPVSVTPYGPNCGPWVWPKLWAFNMAQVVGHQVSLTGHEQGSLSLE